MRRPGYGVVTEQVEPPVRADLEVAEVLAVGHLTDGSQTASGTKLDPHRRSARAHRPRARTRGTKARTARRPGDRIRRRPAGSFSLAISTWPLRMNAAPSPWKPRRRPTSRGSGWPTGISRAIRVATMRPSQSSSSTRGGFSWRIRIRPAPSAHTASTCGSSRESATPSRRRRPPLPRHRRPRRPGQLDPRRDQGPGRRTRTGAMSPPSLPPQTDAGHLPHARPRSAGPRRGPVLASVASAIPSPAEIL